MLKTVTGAASATAIAMMFSTSAVADIELSGGFVQVAPNSVSSNELTLDGAGLGSRVTDIDSNNGWFVGASWRFNPMLSAGITYSSALTHSATESGLGIGNVGRFELDVLTATAQYRFTEDGPIRPYVQAGLIHLMIGSERPSPELISALGTSDISLSISDATGWLVGAGLDVWTTENVALFGEISYAGVETNARYNVGGADLRGRSIDVDPFVYRLGVRYRF